MSEVTVKEYTEAHIKDVRSKIARINFELDQLKFLEEQLVLSLKTLQESEEAEESTVEVVEGELQ